jgi:hypothetical protein
MTGDAEPSKPCTTASIEAEVLWTSASSDLVITKPRFIIDLREA